tara:strand:- start:1490 stop:2257 length:768 start_codon:yes stop_codon:yes gene_type:complete
MLSFTKEKGSRRIARILGGNLNGKYLYLHSSNGSGGGDSKKEILLKEGIMVPLPNRNIVEKIYVTAPSGSGKSTWVGKWMSEYRRMFKQSEIFVFSSIARDKSIDKNDPIRIKLDEELIQDPINPDEIPNSLVVFDDTDTISNVRIKTGISIFRDFMLEQGRHFNIRMLITSHLLSNYKHTRRILNESTCVVVFPKAGSGTFHIKKFLQQYCGFNNKQIKKFINLPSRWVAIYRSYPQYVMYESGCYFPDIDEFK